MSTEYYDKHAERFFEESVTADMSELYGPFLEMIPSGGLILDAGCGSGRDTKAFLERGFQVEAFDASEMMSEMAKDYTGIAIANTSFQDISQIEKYDAVWACASLLHVAVEELPDIIIRMRESLKPGGVLYCSFKCGSTDRVEVGRNFTDMDDARWNQVSKGIAGLSIVDVFLTKDVRPGREVQWFNVLLRKAA